MSKEYPADYTGPEAGHSSDDEWIAVRNYQAFKWIREGIWTFSDFDCYLVAKCRDHHNKLKKRTLVKDFDRIKHNDVDSGTLISEDREDK